MMMAMWRLDVSLDHGCALKPFACPGWTRQLPAREAGGGFSVQPPALLQAQERAEPHSLSET